MWIIFWINNQRIWADCRYVTVLDYILVPIEAPGWFPQKERIYASLLVYYTLWLTLAWRKVLYLWLKCNIPDKNRIALITIKKYKNRIIVSYWSPLLWDESLFSENKCLIVNQRKREWNARGKRKRPILRPYWEERALDLRPYYFILFILLKSCHKTQELKW